MSFPYENSLYDHYDHPTALSLPPISPRAFGENLLLQPYPLSFKHERHLEVFEPSEKPKIMRFREKPLDQDQDETFFQSISDSPPIIIRSPGVLYKESILAQTTPKKKISSRPPQKTPTLPINNPSQPDEHFPSFLRTPLASYSQKTSFIDSFALKRPSQLPLSQFDEQIKLKESPSIVTNFDPDKDREFYDQAVDIYKSFCRYEDNDNTNKS
ncbi:hypothetical protein G9A89_013572 [Geosiphon pyriformis]|nr:hypothetical protein G9A89_013572 [Geosiphon pyriformis]